MKERRVNEEKLEAALKEAKKAGVAKEIYDPAAQRLLQLRSVKALHAILTCSATNVKENQPTLEKVEKVVEEAKVAGVSNHELVEVQALLRRIKAEAGLRAACYGVRRRRIKPEDLLRALEEAEDAGVAPEEIEESEKLVPFNLKNTLVASRARVRMEKAAREGDRASLKKLCHAAEEALVSPRIIWAARKAGRQRLAQEELDHTMTQFEVDHHRLAINVAEARAACQGGSAGLSRTPAFLNAQSLSQRTRAERMIENLYQRRLGDSPPSQDEITKVLSEAKKFGLSQQIISGAQAVLQPKKTWQIAASKTTAQITIAKTFGAPSGNVKDTLKKMQRNKTAPPGKFLSSSPPSSPGASPGLPPRQPPMSPGASSSSAVSR